MGRGVGPNRTRAHFLDVSIPERASPMATVATTPLAALQALGTSVWLDDISRQMLQAGS